MPIISSRVVDALGQGLGALPVTVRLMWASGYIAPEQREGIQSWSTVTAADGTWSIELATNPSGTVYQIEAGGLYREVVLGAAPVQLAWLQATNRETAPVNPYTPFVTAATSGAVGNGVTDDTVALQTAISDSAGRRLMLAPGTYVVSATLNCAAAGLVLEGPGAVIKKAPTMVGPLLSVTAANVIVKDVAFDGNRTGGATGGNILWTGAGGLCERVPSTASTAYGIAVQGVVTLSLRDCTLTSHQGASLADGLSVSAGARVLVGSLYAADCDRAGVNLASAGSVLGQVHVETGNIGLLIGNGTSGSDRNVIGSLVVSQCAIAGLKIDGGAGNNIGRLLCRGQRNADVAVGQGVIYLTGAATTGNRIGYLEYQAVTGFAYVPTALVYATATAASNVIESGVTAAGIVTLTDLNGSNRVDIDDGWIAMTGMTNAWVNYGVPFQTARYKRDRARRVQLSGVVKDGTVAAGATGVIFTLPPGFRPAAEIMFGTIAGGVVGRVNVDAAGAVKCVIGSNLYVPLDGMSFEAA